LLLDIDTGSPATVPTGDGCGGVAAAAGDPDFEQPARRISNSKATRDERTIRINLCRLAGPVRGRDQADPRAQRIVTGRRPS
jgi:hypothetical protein